MHRRQRKINTTVLLVILILIGIAAAGAVFIIVIRREEGYGKGGSSGSNRAEIEKPAVTAAPTPEPTPTPTPTPPPAVTVTVTVPAEYADPVFEIGTQVRGEDGSVTYRLTEAEHASLLSAVREWIREDSEATCSNEEYPHLKSVEPNEDYTAFTLNCYGSKFNKLEQRFVFRLYYYGHLYAACAGTEPENIHLEFRYHDGGVFASRNSSKDEKEE